MKITALMLTAMLSACTLIKTETATIIDFHPAGDAVDIGLKKADGTVLKATRNQESSADTIGIAADALIGL